MAGAVYSVNDFDIYNKGQLNIDGFLLDSIYTDETGMKAALFVRGNNEYVLSFAGTSSWSDWKANFIQGLGKSSQQYQSALELAERMVRNYGNVHLVGHSLGGGLAATAALNTGLTASIYNPAGLHMNTLKKSLRYNDIQHYYSNTDALRYVNILMINRGIMPIGNMNSLGYAGWHSMSDLCEVYGRTC